MVRLRIKELMKEKGVKAPNKALVKMGISHKIAHQYMDGKKQWIVLAHVEKICLFLRCEPNDLFEWTPGDKLQDDPSQPIQKLKPKTPFNVDDELKKLTPDEVRKKFGKDKEDGEKKE